MELRTTSGGTIVVEPLDMTSNFYVREATGYGNELVLHLYEKSEPVDGQPAVKRLPTTVTISEACPEPHSEWSKWTPGRKPQYSLVGTGYAIREMTPEMALAYSTMLILAATRCRQRNEAKLVQLAEQERLNQELQEQARLEQERITQRRSALQEDLQWLVGQKFRLRRRRYRATVFGTIQRVDARGLHTVSEKGKRMYITLDSLEKLEVKWEGERRYNVVHDETNRSTHVPAPALGQVR